MKDSSRHDQTRCGATGGNVGAAAFGQLTHPTAGYCQQRETRRLTVPQGLGPPPPPLRAPSPRRAQLARSTYFWSGLMQKR